MIEGKAELHVDSKVIMLTPGDAWVIPTGASHTYRILKPFTAVEITYPPVRHIRNQTG